MYKATKMHGLFVYFKSHTKIYHTKKKSQKKYQKSHTKGKKKSTTK